MTISTKEGLKLLLILSWIIFVGVCIEAGGCVFSAFYTLVINPVNAATFWVGNDLSALYRYDSGHFLTETLLISIATVLKAVMFYQVPKMLQEKKLDLARPFSTDVRNFIIRLSCFAFGISIFSNAGVDYTQWLASRGIQMPDTQHLHLGGADVWLFMAVTLFVIAQLFKRGIELQKENELTV